MPIPYPENLNLIKINRFYSSSLLRENNHFDLNLYNNNNSFIGFAFKCNIALKFSFNYYNCVNKHLENVL